MTSLLLTGPPLNENSEEKKNKSKCQFVVECEMDLSVRCCFKTFHAMLKHCFHIEGGNERADVYK